jgi:hypothetical protein
LFCQRLLLFKCWKIWKRFGSVNKQTRIEKNAARNFIAHNINVGKWWHDPQIKGEDWITSGKRFTDYILSNEQRTRLQLEERKNACPAKAKNTIRRIMMQINQNNGYSTT